MASGTWRRLALAGVVLTLGAGPAAAHAVWLAERAGEWTIVYGVGPQDEAFDPGKVTETTAWIGGEKRPAAVQPTRRNATVTVPDGATALTTVLDNGFWAQGPDGKWLNKRKSEVPGAKASSRTFKFNTHLFKAGTPAARGTRLEIVPLVDPLSLKPGDGLPVEVRYQGAPARGVVLHHDYVGDANARSAKTDNEGRATVTLRNDGFNLLAADLRVPTPDDPDADRLGLTATLSFVLPFKED